MAPVNDPRTWPNDSDSISSAGIAPQLIATKILSSRAALMNGSSDNLFAGT
jgi:hypothetical protein